MKRFTQLSKPQKALLLLAALIILAAIALGVYFAVTRHRRQTVLNAPVNFSAPAPDDSAPLAPIGDSRANRTVSTAIYLCDINYLTLLSKACDITLSNNQTIEEAVVEAVLHASSDEDYAAVGASDIKLLSLEKSMDVATVDLSIDALRLDAERLHILRAAITNSLLELSGVKYVNVLIDGREEGIVQLPTGTMTRFDNDMNTMWLRALAEEQRFGDSLTASQDLRRNVTLYFGSGDMEYLLPEVRSLHIDSSDFVNVVLNELFNGPARTSVYSRLLPTGRDCLRRAPEIITSDSGYKLVTISFTSELDEYLARNGISSALAYGSIVRSLCGFVPGVDGVMFDVEGIAVTELDDETGAPQYVFEDGVMRRSDFDVLTGTSVTLYYPSADYTRLLRVTRSVSRYSVGSPRALLNLLMNDKGLSSGGVRAVRAMPDNITDADILGVRLEQDQALINLSSVFYKQCTYNMSPARLRTTVYAIVNTICELPGIKSVRFYFDNERADTLGQNIYIKGALLPNPGMVR